MAGMLIIAATALAETPSFPSSISFGNQTLNQPSAATSVTLKNNQAGPLIIRSLAVSGDAASDYTMGGDCPVRSGMLQAKTSCTIAITFTPSALGLRSARLTLTDDAHDSPRVISLSGSGMVSTGAVAAGGNVSNLGTSPLPANTATAGEKMAHRPVRPGATTGSGLLPGSLVPLTSTVSAIGLISIVVTPINTSIGAGATQQFTATGVYSDGATANLTSVVGWSSSSTAVATINGAGLATGSAAGSTVITASYASVSTPPVAVANSVTVSAPPIIVGSPGALSGSTTLTVTAPALASIAVTPANPSISAGKTQQFTATGTYSNNSQQNLTGTVVWTSSAAGIAAINSMGLANAVAVGQATITAALGGISGSTALSVTPGFISSGNLAQARQYHTATLLENGQVLIVGGADKDFDRLPYAELFDPTTGTSTVTGSLHTGRYSHTATLLNNGTVLIAGGIGANGFLNTAELFNPATGTFAPTGTMTTARAYHTATLLPNGQVLLAGGYNGLVAGSAELYDPLTGTFTATGSLQVAREYHTATLLNDGTVLIAAGYDGDVALNSAEIFNPPTGAFTELNNTLNLGRFFHTATLLNNGQVLLAGGELGSTPYETATAETYDPYAQTFTYTAGTLSPARYYHTATLLNNGTVLVTGGCPSADSTFCNANPLTSANVFNPATGTFSPTGNLNIPRAFQTATLLNNGQVLVAGGADDGADDVTNTTELYDTGTLTPSGLVSISLAPTNPTIPQGTGMHFTAFGTFTGGDIEQLAEVTWTSSNPGVISISNDASDAGSAWAITGNSATISACAGMICGSTTASVGPPGPTSTTGTSAFGSTGALNDGRYDHTATLLNNGQVLIAGGVDSTGVSTNSAELFNPATGVFTTTGQMTIPRQQHTATLLPNGLVLIAGGMDNNGLYQLSAELYNPATGTFTATGPMANARIDHTATLLKNGMVLIVGGFSLDAGYIQPAELYNPANGTFTVTGNLLIPRTQHTATLLNDGTVMIGGGVGVVTVDSNPTDAPLQQGEIYNPSSGTFTYTTGMLNVARYGHTATLLNDGTVLLASGGYNNYSSTDVTNTAEIYNPVTGNYTLTGSLATGRCFHTATLLTDGLVLVAGGSNPDPAALSSAELYDPSSASFTPGSSMAVARTYHTATLMNNGLVLLVGGLDQNGNINGTAEIYDVGLLTPPGLSTISISPASPLLPLGGSLQFTPVGNFTGGGTQQLAVVTWSSSNPLAITVSGAGVAYAVAPGSATITACAGPVCGSTLATVGPALVGITVTPASGIVAPSSSLQFAAAGTFDDGSTHDVSALVTWGSTNQAVATISSGGQATGVNAGATTITATSGSLQGSAALSVTGFGAAGNLNFGRYAHTATLLDNGMVLIVGGFGASSPSQTAELYNPATQTFTQTGSPITARGGHTATLLPNGMVLIAGGFESGTGFLSSAELYNPVTGNFTATGILPNPTAYHTATLLPNGLVLIAGGENPDAFNRPIPSGLAALYNPATGTFTATGSLNIARDELTATLLPGGQVLIVGGANSNGYQPSAELYNSSTGTFSYTAGGPSTGLVTARGFHTATMLNNGMVLIAGGQNDSGPLAAAELYNPYDQTFTSTGSLTTGRYQHSATLLSNGTVLVAGGIDDGTGDVTNTVEIYDPVAGTFSPAANLSTGVAQQTATLLSSDSVLIVGGVTDSNDDATNASQLYIPAALTPANLLSISLSPGSTTVPLNTSLTFTAVGVLDGGGTADVASVSWTSSAPGVVSVSNDASDSGTAYALAPGSAVITGCAGAVCGSATVTVGPGLVSITVTPSAATILPGGTQQFSAAGTFDNGVTQDITSSVYWSSSNSSAATIAAGGLATAQAGGSTTITATWGDVEGTATLNVVTAPVLTQNMLDGVAMATATDLPSLDGIVPVILVAGGFDSSGPTDRVQGMTSTGLWEPIGSLNTARYAHTATFLNTGDIFFAGGMGPNGPLSSAELFEPNPPTGSHGKIAYTAGSLATARYGHTATLLHSGMVLIAGGFDSNGNPLSSAELYNPTTQAFSSAGNLNAARGWHTATLLNNGWVLFTGGSNSLGPISGAELYFPETASFKSIGPLNAARAYHSATLLNNGTVLIAGGMGSGGVPLASAEIFNPGIEGFFITGSLNNARFSHSATFLGNGTVLMSGGVGANGLLATQEVYDPNLASFSFTSSLNVARAGHTAILFNFSLVLPNYPNGEVVIAGGYNGNGTLESGELYTPDALAPPDLVAISITPASYLSSPADLAQREAEKLIAVGTFSDGSTAQLQGVTWTSQSGDLTILSDPSNPGLCTNLYGTAVTPTITATLGNISATTTVTSHTFFSTTTGSLNTPRVAHTATLLNTGQVLIAGGLDANGNTLSSAELYDPATGNFTVTGSMTAPRVGHTATLLGNGTVLITGGVSSGVSVSGGTENFNPSNSSTALDTAELYDPVSGTFTPTNGNMTNGLFFHTATLLDNGMVLVVGGSTADLYNPASEEFTATGSPNTARLLQTANLLDNGQVLIAGGISISGGTITNSAELYNPATGTFTNTVGAMTVARIYDTATLMSSSEVLIVGGEDASLTPLELSEVYNPITQTFAAGHPNGYTVYMQTGTLINLDTGVLIAGGYNTTPLSFDALYDPNLNSGTFTAFPSLTNARYLHTATLLPNGMVLIVGGAGTGDVPVGEAELF